MRKNIRSYFILFSSILIGIGTGFSNQKILITAAEIVSTVFINFLSMIAAPIVVLAILSTLISMRGFDQIRTLGRKVLTYTLLTTVLASVVALGCFLVFDPVSVALKNTGVAIAIEQQSYLHFLSEIVPSNRVKAFLENKVISIPLKVT